MYSTRLVYDACLYNIVDKTLYHFVFFYAIWAYKFKEIRGMTDFSDQFRKIIMCYKRIGYNLNIM